MQEKVPSPPAQWLKTIEVCLLLIESPKEFSRGRFLSDRGISTANPDGFASIITMGRRKYDRLNRIRI